VSNFELDDVHPSGFNVEFSGCYSRRESNPIFPADFDRARSVNAKAYHINMVNRAQGLELQNIQEEKSPNAQGRDTVMSRVIGADRPRAWKAAKPKKKITWVHKFKNFFGCGNSDPDHFN
jgi:hypothetical protein